jgi:DNA polymerase V
MIFSTDAIVPADFPSCTLDHMQERLSLDQIYVPRPLSTFIVNVRGDSMINAFIPPKARLIVDRSLKANNGDIVLAELDGEFIVKFLKKNDFKTWLVPANSKYTAIEISEEKKVKIWGVVTAIITDTKDVRGAMM